MMTIARFQEIRELAPKIKGKIDNIDLRALFLELIAEIEADQAYFAKMNETLNSGDGTYKP